MLIVLTILLHLSKLQEKTFIESIKIRFKNRSLTEKLSV
jgi:hypothetical protein